MNGVNWAVGGGGVEKRGGGKETQSHRQEEIQRGRTDPTPKP